jgi:hypothetical protein
MTGPSFKSGITTHLVGQVPVRIFDPAKTVADCFKFRSRVGLDVAVEALRDCLACSGTFGVGRPWEVW